MADAAFFEGRQSTPVPVAHDSSLASALRLTTMKMECNPVGQITITPIVQDLSIGDYIREIRIFSQPTKGAEPELLVHLRLHALSVKPLEIQTPADTF